ncbi:hypothetical protein NECAME_06446 [Necator americanus]|uniref:Uncharacterized protein n=1 Tax=Necator americanus TaxID=51031 RepID=W2TU94_NECAM|nr:hypothetical protein NECAME_06446 [Necator americanus]ETN85358.1 hypothetical protein NECAME_06446 [Necator americanus]
MASVTTASQMFGCELDTESINRKCCRRACVESMGKTDLGIHGDTEVSMAGSMGNTVLEMDLILEQIERNRRIVEQLSPVLKYKEMMRKRRSRAAPRRKFSIAQGYPRITRWKGTKTEHRVSNAGQKYTTNQHELI